MVDPAAKSNCRQSRLVTLVAVVLAAILFYVACAPARVAGNNSIVMIFAAENLRIFAAVLMLFACAFGLGLGLLAVLGIRLSSRVAILLAATAIGLGAYSLAVLGFGLLGVLSRFVILLLLAAGAFVGALCLNKSGFSWSLPQAPPVSPLVVLGALMGLCALVVVFCAATDGILPPVDYDDLEYHLGCPLHYYDQGRIERIEGNVYSNFPQNTEMLYLVSFYLSETPFEAATMARWFNVMVGLLLGLAAFELGRTVFSLRAAWVAAGLLLTMPWVYRLSITAYVENLLTLFSVLAFWAAWKAVLCAKEPGGNFWRFAVLAGLFAGLAMGTKYTAAAFIFFPLVLFFLLVPGITGKARRQGALLFFVFGLLAFMPWMLKNWAFAGNPVFPLLYKWLGGVDWSDKLDARWVAAHSRNVFSPGDFGGEFLKILRQDVWVNVMALVLLPFALIGKNGRAARAAFALYIAYYFAVWYFFTHRVDRFYYPILPFVALLAGYGFSVLPVKRLLVVFSILVGFWAVASALLVNEKSKEAWAQFPANEPSYNFTISGAPDLLNSEINTRLKSSISYLAWKAASFAREKAGPEARVYSLSDAQNVLFPSSVITFTPLDYNPLEDFVEKGTDPREICAWLASRLKVRYIYVNWDEVKRISTTYAYRWRGEMYPGLSDKIQPYLFRQWIDQGILAEVFSVPGRMDIYEITMKGPAQ